MEKQQEKQHKQKKNFLKLLPKAAGAVVSFQNPPFSPGRDHKRSSLSDHHYPYHYNQFHHPPPPPHHNLRSAHHQYHAAAGRGFSGPLVKMIPDEARRKSSKNKEQSSFETNQEPTSPKVSCMGQIKQRHKEKKKIKKTKKAAVAAAATTKKSLSLPKDIKPSATAVSSPGGELKKHASKLRRIFTGSKQPRKSDHVFDDHNDDNVESPQLQDRAPGLSQIKRFASGRNVLADFDWTAQITPVDSDYHRDYYSDEERAYSDGEQEEEEVVIPFSAPITAGGGVALQPRNEINLWKRRTMNPPRPLQLNPLIKAN